MVQEALLVRSAGTVVARSCEIARRGSACLLFLYFSHRYRLLALIRFQRMVQTPEKHL